MSNLNSETISKIATALVTAQSQMGNASKDAKNPFFKSRFADLNAVREACIPLLTANGVCVLQPTIPVDNKQFVKTMLLHTSGEFISSLTEIVCAKQNDPQAYGSAVSYARRYGLQALVCIGAEDNDAEAAMGRDSKPTAEKNVFVAKSGNATTNVTVTSITPDATLSAPVPTKAKSSWSAPKTEKTKGDLY